MPAMVYGQVVKLSNVTSPVFRKLRQYWNDTKHNEGILVKTCSTTVHLISKDTQIKPMMSNMTSQSHIATTHATVLSGDTIALVFSVPNI